MVLVSAVSKEFCQLKAAAKGGVSAPLLLLSKAPVLSEKPQRKLMDMKTSSVRPVSVDAKLKHVSYLEKALEIWHDYWFILALLEKANHALGQPSDYRFGGVTNTYRHLKNFLLDKRSESKFTLEDFVPPRNPLTIEDAFFNLLPVGLKGWCSNSRRIYQIDAELQAVLEVTSLKSMHWGDVILPFPTFAIELSKPLKFGDAIADFVLVDTTAFSEEIDGQLTIWFFDRETLAYEAFPSDSKRSLEDLVKNKKFNSLAVRLEKLQGKSKFYRGCCIFGKTFRNDEFLLEDQFVAGEANLDAVAAIKKTMRIILGLPLYLKSLPAGSPHAVSLGRSSHKAPAQTSKKPRSISEEADIFKISASFKLTRQERVFLELEGTAQERAAAKRELTCHFREGHWRRPPGKGKDPIAKKTVAVRFTIVLRDKLAEGELPAGSAKSVA